MSSSGRSSASAGEHDGVEEVETDQMK